jgi:hypothetical protein
LAALWQGSAAARGDEDPEVVIEWNQMLQSNIPATASVFSFRYYAMLHIAMFDAVNSIEGTHERYHVRVPAHPGASAEAAAAQAAHDVLVELIPASKKTFDSALQGRLATIHPWRAAQGAAVGAKVARAVIDWRKADGAELPNPSYTPPVIPGLWQPTAPGQIAAFAQFGSVKPFALVTPTQYLPNPPPLLNSAEYAADLEQVKALGSSTSVTRTEEQALIARLVAGAGYSPGPFALWSHVAREVTRNHHLPLHQTARLFALLSVSMHDGLQTAHTSKFIYGFWRPITAIRRADEDLNDLTAADPTWTPLLATPPYPSHSSNVACFAASAARILERILQTDAVPFTLTWKSAGGNADVTRTYASFSQLADEASWSRVYGGIHFGFELTASHESCRNVADYVADKYMRRKW